MCSSLYINPIQDILDNDGFNGYNTYPSKHAACVITTAVREIAAAQAPIRVMLRLFEFIVTFYLLCHNYE